tara:strand:+ start:381 stop:1145 length:765 start_codon:yes stop_codon:yes gene_type:complete
MPLSKIRKIAESFDPIGLTEMDSVQLMSRVDTKFVFTLEKLTELLPYLKEHYFLLNVKGVLLSDYESLYFDDKNFSFYYDHHNGKVDRFKIRYRKYVNSNLSFLEVKHKSKGRTDKSRIRVEGIPETMNDHDFDFVRNTGVKSAELNPSLLNNFSRITLVSKKMNERLTIDLNLTYKWRTEEKVMNNIVIAELKQGKAMRNSPFYTLMKNNQIRPLKISKYTIGIIFMYGKETIKYNRFKKKLLKLLKLQKNAA